MKVAKAVIVFILSLALMTSPVEAAGKNRRPFLNIVILLDLSNRIDHEKHPDQADADRAMIRQTVDFFEEAVKKRHYFLAQDQLTVVVAEQASVPPNRPIRIPRTPSQIDMKELRKGEKPSRKTLRLKFDKQKQELLQAVDKLYNQAVTKDGGYPGADIWRFFRDSLKGYLKEKNGDYRNVLVVLTDGYIDFDKEIQSRRPQGSYIDLEASHPLIPVGDFEDFDLNVLVLEINLRDTVADKDKLYRCWGDWLDGMSIARWELHQTFSNTEKILPQFLKASLAQ
jgi:hypothetical protein